jgi:hypothetical protein
MRIEEKKKKIVNGDVKSAWSSQVKRVFLETLSLQRKNVCIYIRVKLQYNQLIESFNCSAKIHI